MKTRKHRLMVRHPELLIIILVLFFQFPDALAQSSVRIPDRALEEVLRTWLDKPEGELTQQDLASLTVLQGFRKGIRSLSGLEGATNLWSLDLRENQIDDLEALRPLMNNLAELHLRNNLITDIEPVSDLRKTYSRTILTLDGNFLDLSEGSPDRANIEKLKNEGILLDDNPQRPVEKVNIADSHLEGLIRSILSKPEGNLTNYDLAEVREIRGAEGGGVIANLSGLEHAVNLRRLDLPRNRITDLSPLSGLFKLKTLDVSENLLEPLNFRSGTLNRETINRLIERRARLAVTLEADGPPVTFPFVEDLSVALDNGAAVITWSQDFAVVYQAQQSADLVRWSDVPTPPAAEPGEPFRLEVEPQSAAHAFYRVLKSLDPEY